MNFYLFIWKDRGHTAKRSSNHRLTSQMPGTARAGCKLGARSGVPLSGRDPGTHLLPPRVCINRQLAQ